MSRLHREVVAGGSARQADFAIAPEQRRRDQRGFFSVAREGVEEHDAGPVRIVVALSWQVLRCSGHGGLGIAGEAGPHAGEDLVLARHSDCDGSPFGDASGRELTSRRC